MSQVDGNIDISFTGTEEVLKKLECFMNENLSNFRSFSYYDVEYNKENQELYLDLYVNEKDILCFLGLIVANIPEVGFSGVTNLAFVGSGGAYYAEYNHKAGDEIISLEDGYDTDDMEDYEFSLELTYNSEDNDKIEKFIRECPIPIIDEDKQDDYNDDESVFFCEKYSGGVVLNSFEPTAEQIKILIDSLQKLSTKVKPLKFETDFYFTGDTLFIIKAVPNEGLSSFIIPVKYTPTSYFE